MSKVEIRKAVTLKKGREAPDGWDILVNGEWHERYPSHKEAKAAASHPDFTKLHGTDHLKKPIKEDADDTPVQKKTLRNFISAGRQTVEKTITTQKHNQLYKHHAKVAGDQAKLAVKYKTANPNLSSLHNDLSAAHSKISQIHLKLYKHYSSKPQNKPLDEGMYLKSANKETKQVHTNLSLSNKYKDLQANHVHQSGDPVVGDDHHELAKLYGAVATGHRKVATHHFLAWPRQKEQAMFNKNKA